MNNIVSEILKPTRASLTPAGTLNEAVQEPAHITHRTIKADNQCNAAGVHVRLE
ncbi:hypothetical protein [Pseudomonas sp. S2_F03]